MDFGDTGQKMANTLKYMAFSAATFGFSQIAAAQDEAGGESLAEAVPAYVPMVPEAGKGMPVQGGLGFQDQYSALGEYALWMHDAVLMPVITGISLLVLFLLIWVMARYNHRTNKEPSRTSHNTLIEVIWTLVPVLILVGIAVPSIDLLAKQYKPAPKEAVTVKVTGYQWYWGYEFPDNGGVEIISKMLNEPNYPEINPGVREVGSHPSDGPAKLEVDNRLVLPVGEPIRLQITAADVIHSFAVPSLWFKLDAVPGRLNEKTLFIKEPGVYYGQCSELCGVKHAYMPIAVEALPREQFEAWLIERGGELPNAKPQTENAQAENTGPTEADAAAPAA